MFLKNQKLPPSVIIVLGLFLSIFYSNILKSQTIQEVDNQTYQQYLSADWKNLIKSGEAAHKQGIDFFYLRLRLGIAYFSVENYDKAAFHLEKSLLYDDFNVTAKTYLYYSFLYSNQNLAAFAVAQKMPESLRKELKIKSKVIEKISISNTNAFALTARIANIKGDANIYAEDERYLGLTNVTLGLNHLFSIGKTNFSLSHAYNGFWIPKEKHFQHTNGDTIFSFQQQQHGYYAQLSAQLPRHWQANVMLNFSRLSSPNYAASFDNQSFTYSYTNQSKTSDFLTLGISASYRRKNWGLTPFAFFSNMTGQQVAQIGVEGSFFPFGNLNFYTTTIVSAKANTPLSNGAKPDLVGGQKIGAKIGRGLWVEAEGTFGNMQNWVSPDGFNVYNVADKIWAKYGGRIIFAPPSVPRIQGYIKFDVLQRENQYFQYLDATNTQFINYKNSNNLLTIGFQWKM